MIRKTLIPIKVTYLPHSKLRFFSDNPRVYSVVHDDDDDPSQEAIERKLRDHDHVRELRRDIEDNGGLTDPVIVLGDTLEVVEGNSRLAAYRMLADKDPLKWSLIKCMVLPKSIDESLVLTLLGNYHLKGKTEWPPYEQAGFLHRRFHQEHLNIKALAHEMGLRPGPAKQLIDAFAFMVANKDNTRARWSYYFEFTKSNKIKKARKENAGFEKAIVAKIKSGEIETAQDLRDKLPVICESKKALARLIAGASTFEDAFEEAENSGVTNDVLQKLNRFRMWIAIPETQTRIVNAKAGAAGKIRLEVQNIYGCIRKLKDDLKDL